MFPQLFPLTMASVQKVLEGTQEFLRGIKQLSSYEEQRDKQAKAIGKSLTKTVSLQPAHAAQWLQRVDDSLWSTDQVLEFKRLIAEKTRGDEDRERGLSQDFTMLPHFLSEDLVCDCQKESVDREHLLFRLCAHAAKLSLKHGTEASKATLICLAYWPHFQRGMSPREKYQWYLKKKPLVSKYLSTQAIDGKPLICLPLTWQEVPEDIQRRTFPSGEPCKSPFAMSVVQFVAAMPLRKDNKLLEDGPTTSTGTDSTSILPVAQLSQLAASTAVATVTALQKAQSSDALVSHTAQEMTAEPTGPVLALCDKPATATLEKPLQSAAVEEPRVPEEETQELEESKPKRLSVAAQVAAMRESVRAPVLKRPAAKPASQKGLQKKTTKQVLKRPAASKEARPSAIDPRRAAVLQIVPWEIAKQFRNGCKRCRDRPWCTRSCWFKRGYSIPL